MSEQQLFKITTASPAKITAAVAPNTVSSALLLLPERRARTKNLSAGAAEFQCQDDLKLVTAKKPVPPIFDDGSASDTNCNVLRSNALSFAGFAPAFSENTSIPNSEQPNTQTLHNKPSAADPTTPRQTQIQNREEAVKTCTVCETQTTPAWRRGPNTQNLCNSCGLKWKRGDVQLNSKSILTAKDISALQVAQRVQISTSGATPTVSGTNSPFFLPIAVNRTGIAVYTDKNDGKMGGESVQLNGKIASIDSSATNIVNISQINVSREKKFATVAHNESTVRTKLQTLDSQKRKNVPKKSSLVVKKGCKGKTRNKSSSSLSTIIIQKYDDDISESGSNDHEDFNKKYDPDLFYIQCDGCDEWFHGICANINEEQAERIFLWFCRICERDTGRRSVFKKFCAAWLADKETRTEINTNKIEELELPESNFQDYGDVSTPVSSNLGSTFDKISKTEMLQEYSLQSRYSLYRAENSRTCATALTVDELSSTSTPELQKTYLSSIISPLSPEPSPQHVSLLYHTPETCLKYLPDPVATNNTSSHLTDTFSRYCSPVCGISVSKYALVHCIRQEKIPMRKYKRSTEEERATREEPHVLEAFDAIESQKLRDLAICRNRIELRINALKNCANRVAGAVWRAKIVNYFVARVYDDGKENKHQGKTNGKKKRRVNTMNSVDCFDEGHICAFDARIAQWWSQENQNDVAGLENFDQFLEEDDYLLDDEVNLEDVEEASSVDEIKSLVSQVMCVAQIESCQIHSGWQIIKVKGIELEINNAVSSCEEIRNMTKANNSDETATSCG
ncbi:hypothetical protein HK100_000955 [Physocladia obscura]|uniref:GATA-type domain-containing protein n=1 Tax=Physocladia obscura TaxID=109957 RepID=A0AAD5T7S0_9FUNG|nr:hypothetical protein HK100_000955 [Physocladia obscura]